MYDQKDIAKLGILIDSLKNYKLAMKSYIKRRDAAWNNGELIPRKGPRGGKKTTLDARLEVAGDYLRRCEEKIKEADKEIGML